MYFNFDYFAWKRRPVGLFNYLLWFLPCYFRGVFLQWTVEFVVVSDGLKIWWRKMLKLLFWLFFPPLVLNCICSSTLVLFYMNLCAWLCAWHKNNKKKPKRKKENHSFVLVGRLKLQRSGLTFQSLRVILHILQRHDEQVLPNCGTAHAFLTLKEHGGSWMSTQWSIRAWIRAHLTFFDFPYRTGVDWKATDETKTRCNCFSEPEFKKNKPNTWRFLTIPRVFNK